MVSKRVTEEPLYLEDQCLIYLIRHLEDFTPQMLASLPLPVRQRLLGNLPAVDVVQIENCSISSTDMEMRLWKGFVEERMPEYAASMKDNYKCYYFEVVSNIVLNGTFDYQCAKEMLFSVPAACLGGMSAPQDNIWNPCNYWSQFELIGHPDLMPLPTRHDQHFSRNPLSQSQLVECLMETCQYFPKTVSISCNTFFYSDWWQGRCSGTSLGRFLSKTKVLHLEFIRKEYGQIEKIVLDGIPQFIVEAVFSNRQPVMEVLYLKGHMEYVSHAVTAMATFFSDNHITSVQVLLS